MHCGENQAAEQQSKSAFHWKPPELNVALTARAVVLACLAMSGGRKIVNEIDDSDNSARSMYRSAAHTNRTSQIRHITPQYLPKHHNVLDKLMLPLSGRDTTRYYWMHCGENQAKSQQFKCAFLQKPPEPYVALNARSR
jgi:hypothetical protein